MNWLDDPRPERILLAGAELARRVPVRRRPRWVGGVIESLSPVVVRESWRENLGRVIVLCRTEALWPTASALFEEFRAERLSSRGVLSQVPPHWCDLLELACKVSHNASGVAPGFDAHAATRVLGLARHALDSGVGRTEARVADTERALLAEVTPKRRSGLLSWED